MGEMVRQTPNQEHLNIWIEKLLFPAYSIKWFHPKKKKNSSAWSPGQEQL
jgi:hypothetical protein